MQIDRSNYEIWLIDWLDGNLDAHQVERLKLYLEQNPDIREEFNDLPQMYLVPEGISFRYKEHLKKTPSEISGSQFDYLCTAALGNDLTDSQQAELTEIVNQYPDRKKSYDLIQKTILARETKEYKYKSNLLKRTAIQKVIRLSVISLSSAAAIFLIIILFSVIYRTTNIKVNSFAYNFISDSTLNRSSSEKETDRILKDNIAAPVEKKSENRFADINKKNQAIPDINILVPSIDSILRRTDYEKIAVNKVPVHSRVDLVKEIASDILITVKPIILIADVENERSKAGKFISKTFREKFLKEKTPTDSPLKGYEIAEAGISGLNKLFGWQMVLDMKNDDHGQPSSVYFSSKILKLNAPVKKKEPRP